MHGVQEKYGIAPANGKKSSVRLNHLLFPFYLLPPNLLLTLLFLLWVFRQTGRLLSFDRFSVSRQFVCGNSRRCYALRPRS